MYARALYTGKKGGIPRECHYRLSFFFSDLSALFFLFILSFSFLSPLFFPFHRFVRPSDDVRVFFGTAFFGRTISFDVHLTLELIIKEKVE